MLKVIDFDSKFMEYTSGWLALHPGLTPKQAEESYNKIMNDWLNAPAAYLGGKAPGTYFDEVTDPAELVALVKKYDKAGYGLPEILYRRVVSLGEACVEPLHAVLTSLMSSDALRATVMGMLLDIASPSTLPICTKMIVSMKEPDDLTEMASELIMRIGQDQVPALLDAYPTASDYAQLMILEICCCFPGDERIYTYTVARLRAHPDNAALCASFLEKLGDERAIAPLCDMLGSSEVKYLDYIELRNAIESLGGDVGEERDFSGDPDYEAMKYMK